MAETVKVGCRVVNGVMLFLWRKGYDDGTGDGVAPTVKDGPGVRLNGISALRAGIGNTAPLDHVGVTEVDKEWMARWMEQNRGKNPLFDQGMIYVIEEPKPAANPT